MPEEFPERLREARKAKGLSQADVADRAGLKPSAISHFETGRRSPSFNNLKRLADALSVSVDYLLGREDEPKAVGPKVQQLFRHFEKMSSEDQAFLEEFVDRLRKKDETDEQ
jgi:transcriptional regulator with XRE-family HTH domain